jgi:radical SAM protein with 4Fe4S-binding SPASM domain
MGEPLLNKNICDFVTWAKDDGHTVAFTSNGALLTPELSKKLLQTGIDRIIFSVDGFKAETYEKIRVGSDYETVKNNILNLSQNNKELGNKTKIQIDCILSDLTKDEIEDMKKFWTPHINFLKVIPLNDWGGNFDLPDKFGMSDKELDKNKRYPCDLLWTTINVSAEGNVMYCCHDYKLDSKLPNVNEKSLSRIWAEDVGIERQKHVSEAIDRSPCLACEAWLFRPEKYKFSLGNFIPISVKKFLKKLIGR